jgi:hypothetical protein
LRLSERAAGVLLTWGERGGPGAFFVVAGLLKGACGNSKEDAMAVDWIKMRTDL